MVRDKRPPPRPRATKLACCSLTFRAHAAAPSAGSSAGKTATCSFASRAGRCTRPMSQTPPGRSSSTSIPSPGTRSLHNPVICHSRNGNMSQTAGLWPVRIRDAIQKKTFGTWPASQLCFRPGVLTGTDNGSSFCGVKESRLWRPAAIMQSAGGPKSASPSSIDTLSMAPTSPRVWQAYRSPGVLRIASS
jgi:hypothetical protein